MRWLLLDQVISIQPGTRAVASARIPQGNQVTPEVLMIEMMAQTGGILLGAQTDFASDVVFTKIEQAQFQGPFEAGDSVLISASSENIKPEGAWIDAEIKKDQFLIAGARLLLMNVGRLVPGARESITFHREFMNHFKIREKIQ